MGFWKPKPQPPASYGSYLDYLGVTPAMSRMPQMADPRTIGPSFHTADQEDQRHYLGTGFDGNDSYDADPRKAQRPGSGGMAPADANACKISRHPDGSASTVRLEATADGWIDTGSTPPRDMRVVNW